MTHPRLFFTAAQLEGLRAKAADTAPNPFMESFHATWAALEETARQFLAEDSFTWTYYGGKTVTYPLPPRQPELFANPPGFTVSRYPYWTGMCSAIKQRVETLALAYAVTGERAFGERAKAYTLALAGWETWSDPTYNCGWGRTCLDTGYLTQAVATAYDQVHDLLSPAEQAQVRRALATLGMKPLFLDLYKRWDHNIHMVRTSALGYAALAVLGEVDEADACLERVLETYRWYLQLRADSRNTEGMLYTSVSMDHALKFGDALYRVTGRDEIICHPYVTGEMAQWIAYFLAPGGKGLTNFSDCSLVNYFGASLAVMAANNGDGLAGWYLQETKAAQSTLPGFLLLNHDTPVTTPRALAFPRSHHFAKIGWAALRTGWEAGDNLLAFLSSPSNLGHNHFDQNHFVLNVAGQWLITDPGYQDYNPGPKNAVTEGSLGHNVLLVNGQGQAIKGGGRVTGFESTPEFDYVGGEASAAYGGVTAWHREIIHAPGRYYLIRDTVRLDAPGSVELLVHTDTAADLQVDATGFTICKENARVSGQVLLPAKASVRKDIVAGAEEWGPFVRIGTPAPTDAAAFVWILLPAAAGAEPAVERVGPETVRVTGPDWSDTWSVSNDLACQRRDGSGALVFSRVPGRENGGVQAD
jgi:hypothetical protein